MGEEWGGSLEIEIGQMWAGWYPGRPYSDIPSGQAPKYGPIGSPDADSVVWFDGKLRKLFGYQVITGSALDGAVTSLFYTPTLSDVVGTAGTKIYSQMWNTSPIDVTGSVTVSSGTPVSWAEWQLGTTKYNIGVQIGNPPWKYTGSGNALALGGSPPSGAFVASFQNSIWIAKTSTAPTTVYFSATADPETWDLVFQNYVFDSVITGMSVLADMLVVFKEQSIGILSGTNNAQLNKIDKFIQGIGCPSPRTIRPGKLQGRDVIFFHSYSGWYAFDGTPVLIRLSTSIMEKYVNSSSSSRWNATQYSSFCSAWWPEYQWILNGVSDAADSSNNTELILDTSRLMNLAEGTTVPHWKSTGFPASVLEGYISSFGYTVMLFGHVSDGKVYWVKPDVFTKAGTGYTGYWVSNILDLGASYVINEVNIVSDPLGAATSLNAYLDLDFALSPGQKGTHTLDPGGDELDSTFILDTSTLGGKLYLNQNVQVTGYGRYLQLRLENSDSGGQMGVYTTHLILTPIGIDPNAADGL